MGRPERKNLIESIERKRGTKVIAYVTSDRPNLSSMITADVVSLIHTHIQRIPRESRSKLDLFIYSRGRSSDVPRALVSMFREYFHKGSFSVLVPYRAHSGCATRPLRCSGSTMGSAGTKVRIELLKAGEVVKTITNGTAIGSGGSGSYSWKVPSNQATGTDYQIRVTNTTACGYTDVSNANFTIN